jgi:hypothetical protein
MRIAICSLALWGAVACTPHTAAPTPSASTHPQPPQTTWAGSVNEMTQQDQPQSPDSGGPPRGVSLQPRVAPPVAALAPASDPTKTNWTLVGVGAIVVAAIALLLVH